MPIHATRQQIMQALDKLTPDEWTMLTRGACKRIGGTSFSEPAELLNEAVTLLLEGRRRWPLHVGFGPFVQITMRSVAGNDRDLACNEPGTHVPWEHASDGGASGRLVVPSVEESLSESQRGRIMAEAAMRARADLEGDRYAQLAIDAMLCEMTPAEACDELGIPPNEFEPARKRGKRRIERALQAGLRPGCRTTGAMDG